ncbi:uncharacterized protein [Aristolochia californica]|uniref:uncharacterized protein n=1 Tax=Aristolochia californica TaxID=171875 RepID=UPI0035DE13F5
MEERSSKGLCYNCDEQYTFGHQCQKLFWLEVTNEGEEVPEVKEPQVEEPEISLHAITGIQSTTTMQLPIQPRPIASLSVANGENFQSYGINKAIMFSIEAAWVAPVFFANIVCLHGILESIVSDRNVATPLKILYDRDPPHLLSYAKGSTRVDTVDQALLNHDQLLEFSTLCLQKAQARMKAYYDQHHHDIQYNQGDFVLLHLQPYHQHSIAGTRHNLSLKYFGPFQILQRVGQVAYKLNLPPKSKLHNVFHVSLLKPLKGSAPLSVPSLSPIEDGKVDLTPTKIFSARQHEDETKILVQWTHTDATEATWEDLAIFKHVYPTFDLADKLFLHGESDVMDSIARRDIQRRRGELVTQGSKSSTLGIICSLFH